MIKCYDEKLYTLISGIFGLILFIPIAAICIGGAIASGVIWLIKVIRRFMK